MKKSESNVTVEITNELKKTKLEYRLERDEGVNTALTASFKKNPSKQGGAGGGIPDTHFTLRHNGEVWFGIVENKAKFADMEKLKDGLMDNSGKSNINKFAVNGALYYAKNCFRDTEYKNYLVIGACGEENSFGKYELQVKCYVLSNETGGEAIHYITTNNLSFLYAENLDGTMQAIKTLHIPEEQKEKIRLQNENQVKAALSSLNEKMWSEYKIDAKWRISIFVGMVLAGLGDADGPLKIEDLKGSHMTDNTDADIILRKVRSVLQSRNLPADKLNHIMHGLTGTLKHDTTINTKTTATETVLKSIYSEVKENIMQFVEYKMIDFAGAVYNEVTTWMSLADDEANDVVLTPRYIIDLMVKLAKVNKDSYVWDFALGSGGFLISALNEAIHDAQNITNESERKTKIKHIKENQLLGIEIRPDIQMLAILNMFLVGDGSSRILQANSLTQFENEGDFPADVFLLNPPYSADGNGMIFVKKALSMMKKGRAVIIVQDSAGSGKATEINKNILQNNTLVASIKMPVDVFIGKSSVQTSVYVFDAAKPHEAKQPVRFIDFRNDGYKRSNRKTKDKSINLRDVDNAKARYAELVDLVLYGEKYLNIFTKEEYVEDIIKLEGREHGNDWNFEKHKIIDTRPTEADFRKTVADYMAWEVDQLLKTDWTPDKEGDLGK
ncbi:MAG: SAM-dependent methyltransferase [Defluviitaleaceae bacterium]|nr:SAM-dependent methyltransferase [Defluviitaleaceae bacterium]